MKRAGIYLLAITFVLLVPAFAAAAGFLENPYWDVGKAEFQVYDAEISRYGIPRNGTVKLILVKEPFDAERRVKTGVAGAPEVIKMNYIQAVPAGVYDYSQMASFFFERATGRLLKYSMSSQDGCGHTFMQYLPDGARHEFVFHSYYDDQGDALLELKAEGPIVFYDALPLVLRFRLGETQPYTLKLVPGLIRKRRTAPRVVEATVVNSTRRESFKTQERMRHGIRKVTVKFEKNKDVLWFEPEFPHRMVRWKKHNGDGLVLKHSRFFYYWEFTKPGDSIEKGGG